MILDESGRHWFQVLKTRSPDGGDCTESRCIEHRRLTMLAQRPTDDVEYVTTFHVDGIKAQHYHTADEAITAMEANPCS
jgi:hypothetical protein